MIDFENLAAAMGELDEDTVKEILEAIDNEADAGKAMDACQKGMDTVGKLFEEGEYFVGDLIYAGELMTDAVEVLKPYLAAAMRSGLTAGWPQSEDGSFEADAPITGAEAAVMLQSAMDLAVSTCTMDGAPEESEDAWAETAIAVMAENGIHLEVQDPLTRGQVAVLLYQVSQMAKEAPGLQMYQ